jgi:hypothetical protein
VRRWKMNKQLVKYYANHYRPTVVAFVHSGKNSSNKQKYFSSSARFYAGEEMLVKIIVPIAGRRKCWKSS